MPREDKGTSSASPLKDASGGNDGNTSSLAARRARLRGTLARATTAQDETYEQMPAPAFGSEGMMGGVDEAAAAPEAAVESTSSTPDVAEGGFDQAGGGGSSQPPANDDEGSTQLAQEPQFHSVPAPVSDPDPASVAPAAAPTAPAAPANPELSPFSQDSSPWGEDPNPSPAPNLLAAFIPAPVTSPPVAFTAPPQLPALAEIPPNALELLHSIDQAMNACATNLASLQRLSGEQTDVLKNLTNTLQNQTLSQIGLNLNSLTDSLSAALEPMKAIGELVPAMDQLVTTLEGKEAYPQQEKMSQDQLVTSLADQLSAGLIDPWTFRCAYMAVYPTDHPADLLHRLVELLGTQRLSGDLFRAAYEAVQAAEPPAGAAPFMPPSRNLDPAQLDETIKKQLDQLQKSNDEMRKRQEEREAELQRILETKDKELADLQEKMQQAPDADPGKEEEYQSLLESKDMELVEKESENNMLRAQMEELRSQTEEMVKDMQKQISDMKVAHDESVANQPPKPVSSFFDNAPSPARSLFDSGPQKSLFDQQANLATTQPTPAPVPVPAPAPAPMPLQQMAAAQMTPQPMAQTNQQVSQGMQAMAPPAQSAGGLAPPVNAGGAPPSTSPVVPPSAPAPPPAPPAPPSRPAAQPATTPFTQGQGSYGSGVRAQVFEVIVRQALAGAPWREICAGPMQVNNITPDEVEAEVKRRQALLNK